MQIKLQNGIPKIITQASYSSQCCCSCPVLSKDWGNFPCQGLASTYQLSWNSENNEGVWINSFFWWYYILWIGAATITAVSDSPCTWEGEGGECYFVPRGPGSEGQEPFYIGPGWFRIRGPTYQFESEDNCSSTITLGYVEGRRKSGVTSAELIYERTTGLSSYPKGMYGYRDIFGENNTVQTEIIVS